MLLNIVNDEYSFSRSVIHEYSRFFAIEEKRNRHKRLNCEISLRAGLCHRRNIKRASLGSLDIKLVFQVSH